MSEIHIRYLEEAILQLLKEKTMIEHENRFYSHRLDPEKRRELLSSIALELNALIERYTEQTGRTLKEFLHIKREEKIKEREKTKFYYI